MGVKSAKNSNKSKYLNKEQYEVDDIIFANMKAYKNIQKINMCLEKFYTRCDCTKDEDSVFVRDCGWDYLIDEELDCNCETIFDSPFRDKREEFIFLLIKLKSLLIDLSILINILFGLCMNKQKKLMILQPIFVLYMIVFLKQKT